MGSRLRNIFAEHPGQFISGEEISRRMGTTRAAVWKQVQSLRAAGYKIEGMRGEGYRLLSRPDLVNAEELQPLLGENPICTALKYFPETDSTNARAMELAEKGAAHGGSAGSLGQCAIEKVRHRRADQQAEAESQSPGGNGPRRRHGQQQAEGGEVIG